MENEKLSKKEQRNLEYQEKMDRKLKEEQRKKLFTWAIIAVIVLIVAAGIWWAAAQSSKPLPGTATKDLGREHISDISKVKYASNPPTSGPHFPMWAKRGVYPYVISDGYLVHSEEHGYIVMWYNCEGKALSNPTGGTVLTQLKLPVQGTMSPITPSTTPPKEVDVPQSFSSGQCKKLVADLSAFLQEFDRIVIVPRPWMDNKITLTAWDRIEKFNSVDMDKMREFIQAFHNKGPEITTE